MKCSKCNNEIDDNSTFCMHCGARISNTEEQEELIFQESNAQEQTQSEAEEPVIEEKDIKENVVEDDEENEPLIVSATEAQNNNDVKRRKRRFSIITIAVAIAILISIIAGSVIMYFTSMSSQKIYKEAVKYAVTKVYRDNLIVANTANVNGSLEINTSIDGLKDIINGIKLNANIQYDLSNKQFKFGINLDKDKESYLNAKIMADLVGNQALYSEANLFDREVKSNISEQAHSIIKQYIGEDETLVVDKDIPNKSSKKIYKAINNSFDKEYFSRKKTTININGKDKKVKDNILTISYAQLEDAIKNITSTLKMDNEFLNCYIDRDQMLQYLDSIDKFVDEFSDIEKIITVHLYTSGITNNFVEATVIISDDYANEVIFDIVKASNKTYQLTIKQTTYGSTEPIANAVININKSTKKDKDISLKLNFKNGEEFDLKIITNGIYNKGIEAIDTSNAIDYKDLTKDDYQTIYNNLVESKLYQVYSEYIDEILNSFGIKGNTLKDDRDIPVGIDLKRDQSFVESYNDDVIVFDVPSTFEDEYAGLAYQRFSKEEKTKKTAYIDVDFNSNTLQDYEKTINESASFYSAEKGYKDVKLSEREEIKVNDVTFYKRNFECTYQSGAYSSVLKHTYYYTAIADDHVYSVELDDVDNIVTEAEIEKMLTISTHFKSK